MSEQELPVQAVLDMREKGYDNNKIIQELQTQGYDSSSIFDALNHADMEAMSEDDDMDFMEDSTSKSEKDTSVTDEELIEQVIQEKWDDLVSDLEQIADWKADTDNQLERIQGRMDSIEKQMSQVQDALTDKLGEYDSTMKEVGSDVKAMEDVFSDVLPEFKENVAQLQDVVKGLNKK